MSVLLCFCQMFYVDDDILLVPMLLPYAFIVRSTSQIQRPYTNANLWKNITSLQGYVNIRLKKNITSLEVHVNLISDVCTEGTITLMSDLKHPFYYAQDSCIEEGDM